jgi:hypothetical protein
MEITQEFAAVTYGQNRSELRRMLRKEAYANKLAALVIILVYLSVPGLPALPFSFITINHTSFCSLRKAFVVYPFSLQIP